MKRTIYITLLPLVAVGFASEIAPHILVPSLPDIATSLALSNTQATGLMSSYYLTLSLSFLVAGIFGHRFSKKTILIAASLLVLCGSLVMGLTHVYWIMIMGRVMQAIGAGAVTVVGQTWIGQSATERNVTKLFSYLTIFLSFAPLLAPIVGGFVNDMVSWRYNFYLVAVLAAIALVFIVFTTPPPPENCGKLSLKGVLKTYYYLLVKTHFFSIVAATLACFLSQGALMSYSSFLFIDELGISASLFGFISIPVVAGIITGQFPVILLEKCRGLRAAYAFSTVCAVVALAGSFIFYHIRGTHSIYELAVMLFLFNIGFGGHNLIATKIVMSRFSSVRSYSSALLNFLSDLTNYFAALIVQLLFVFIGFSMQIHNIFLVSVTLLLILAYPLCKRQIY